jgi:hypothetical protein
MNEPSHIAQEILALSLLAGFENDGKSKAPPESFQHVSIEGLTLFPVAPSSSLFGYKCPAGSCMIWTYISVYTSLADESSAGVNFGFNYNADVSLRIQGASGNFISVSAVVDPQTVFNKPLMLVFGPETTPRFIIGPGASTQAIGNLRIFAAANAYLLPAGLQPIFQRYATQLQAA